jgi:Family of unknown function (DUF6275)
MNNDPSQVSFRPLAPTPAVMDRKADDKEDSSEDFVQDSDRYLRRAKNLVIENYNDYHKPGLRYDEVYVISFTKILTSWKALLGSSVVRGQAWLVTHNGPRRETYLDIYKKSGHVKFKEENMP